MIRQWDYIQTPQVQIPSNSTIEINNPLQQQLKEDEKTAQEEYQLKRDLEFKNYISNMWASQQESQRNLFNFVGKAFDLNGKQIQDLIQGHTDQIAALSDYIRNRFGSTDIGIAQQQQNFEAPAYTSVASPKDAKYNFFNLKTPNGFYRSYNNPIEGLRAGLAQLGAYISGTSQAAKGFDIIQNGASVGSPTYTPWGNGYMPASYKPFANGVNPNTINHIWASGLFAPHTKKEANNYPEEYASFLSNKSGIGRDVVLDINNIDQMSRLLPAIAKMEGSPMAHLVTPELVRSLYDPHLVASKLTQDRQGTSYLWGGRNPYSGKGVDCSGWTGYILEQQGLSGYRNLTAAEQIKKAEQTGKEITLQELLSDSHINDALIALEGKDPNSNSGKYKNIVHIGYIYWDPLTEERMVTDSSSSKGVHNTPLKQYLDWYQGKENRRIHIIKLNRR